MKDLPRVYANPINNDINHNRTFSYGKLETEKFSRDADYVEGKLSKLFKSDRNIYSIDCLIKFATNEERYTIIGRTNNNLVTKNQKLIPIREIYDIDLA